MPFIEGEDRNQTNLLPNTLEDYGSQYNSVRAIDVDVNGLNLEEMGFEVFSGQNAGHKPYKRESKTSTSIFTEIITIYFQSKELQKCGSFIVINYGFG